MSIAKRMIKALTEHPKEFTLSIMNELSGARHPDFDRKALICQECPSMVEDTDVPDWMKTEPMKVYMCSICECNLGLKLNGDDKCPKKKF